MSTIDPATGIRGGHLMLAERPARITERARQPGSGAWQRVPIPRLLVRGNVLRASGWKNGALVVLSTLELAPLPDGSGDGLQWHLTVSRGGVFAAKHEVRQTLRDFNLVEALEADPTPDGSRHYWLPVDPAHVRPPIHWSGVPAGVCPAKDDGRDARVATYPTPSGLGTVTFSALADHPENVTCPTCRRYERRTR